MWTPCSNILDEPIMVLFWEFSEFQRLFISPFVLQLVTGPLIAWSAAVVCAVLAYRLKRGQPAGALVHLLHAWEFVPLPGVLSPYPHRYSPWGDL